VRLSILPLLAACGAPAPEPPSVLVITLDTTRADRLGPYGYIGAMTPAYDRLASEGTVFNRAYSTCPLTIPSHSTIFTGKVPPSHGVRDNGDYILGDEQITLAERFRDAGYRTAAFTAAFPTQRRWGFSQGFEVYSDPLDAQPTELDWRDERRAGEVVDDALATLPTMPGPQFVWVHLFDAHWPYEPPPEWELKLPGRPYDGEIAYAAQQVARLIDWWDRAHPNSIIVITSDHGEGLGDGGEMTHGFLLHDGTIHVPLIVRGTGVPAGRTVDDPVGHADIAPTVLRLAGLTPHEGMQGHDLFDGGSERNYSEALTGQFNLGLAPLFAYTDGGGRYTEGGYGRWYPVLGDSVLTAPDLTRDVTAESQRLAQMRAAFDEVIAPEATLDAQGLEQLAALGYLGGDTVAAAGTVDPRDVIDIIPLTWRARQAMSEGRLVVAEQMVAQLEERMPETYGVDLLRAQMTRLRGQPLEAIEQYTALYLRSPSSTVAMQLADLNQSIGDMEEALSWSEEALALQPASPEAMGAIVRALVALDRPADAEDYANQFLVAYPDHAELMLVRAELLLAEGRAEDALADASYALTQVDRNPYAYAVTARALWELGRPDAAIDDLKEALEIDKWNLGIRMELTEWYLDVGRNAEAVRTILPASRLLPDEPEVQELTARAQAALDGSR
jgi:choline-sulfatase